MEAAEMSDRTLEQVIAILARGTSYGFLRLGLHDPRNTGEPDPLEDRAILSAQEEGHEGSDD